MKILNYKTLSIRQGSGMILCVLMSLFLVVACSEDEEESVNPALTISSFSPDSGTVGIAVVITGSGFSSTATENSVYFNGTEATVASATSTVITVTVPEGASTGAISVVVNGDSVTSSGEFTVVMEGPGGFPGNGEGGGFPGGGGTATNNGYANVDPAEVSSCSALSGIEKIVCIAEEFKALLNEDQLATVQLDYSLSNAQIWSNFPEAIYGNRLGLSLGEMDSAQVAYAKALLKEILGSRENEGWDELRQHLIADNYLNEAGGGDSYGAFNFYLAFLGTPSTSGTFEIQFGGHHYALSNTYTDGELVGATPSFRGIEPYGSFTYKGESYQTMNDERDAFSAMLNGLSGNELATAKLSGTFGDIIAGPQKDNNIPSTPSGLKVGNLSEDKKQLVLAAIATYVYDLPEDEAQEFMAVYESELDDTYIGYSGTTTMTTRNDYVRIDGPSVWIEASIQGGVVLPDPHPHTIWRDKTSDYGGN